MPREIASPAFTVPRESAKTRGRRLAIARKRQGLRQEDAAEEMAREGLLPTARYQTVSDWERGLSEPSLDQLTWLRERYGFDWGWYFTGLKGEAATRLDVIGRIANGELDGRALSVLRRGSPERIAAALAAHFEQPIEGEAP